MSGASLISRFALTNSAHAKLNNLGIEILKNQVIKLNGKELYILDPSTVESDEKNRVYFKELLLHLLVVL